MVLYFFPFLLNILLCIINKKLNSFYNNIQILICLNKILKNALIKKIKRFSYNKIK